MFTCEALQIVGIEAPTDDDQRAAVEVSLDTRRKRGDDVVDVGLDVDAGFAKELALTLFPSGRTDLSRWRSSESMMDLTSA